MSADSPANLEIASDHRPPLQSKILTAAHRQIKSAQERIEVFHVEVIRTGEALGAEIRGVDIRNIQSDEFESIYRAWLDNQVLLFREQRLTDEDLIAFSRR